MESDSNSVPQISIGNPENKNILIKFIDNKYLPPHWRIGTGLGANFMRTRAIDAIDAMAKMSPQELYVLLVLKNDLLKVQSVYNPKTKKMEDQFYSSCHVKYNASLLNQRQKAKFKEGTKRLKDKGLILLEGRQRWMINPNFIIPTNYQKEENDWINLSSIVS